MRDRPGEARPDIPGEAVPESPGDTPPHVPGEAPPGGPAGGPLDVRRAVVGGAVLVLALAAAGWALYGHRRDFTMTFERIGAGPVLLSAAFGLVGVAATYPLWRSLLGGLGVDIPWGDGARVFFVSQLGKYVPGSVWPVIMQMEAGRRRGATRAKMLWANLSALILGCTVGLVVACALLPIYDRQALARYWWALLALPALIAVLHPRVLPWALERVMKLMRRPPAAFERIDPMAELRAAGWSLLSWAALGAQVAVLVVASGRSGFAPVALAVGGVALAISVGILFIPAPAGAGIRDVVLGLVLGVVLAPGPAIAVVVGSRAILVICDVALAGLAALGGLRRAGERTRTSTPFGTRT